MRPAPFVSDRMKMDFIRIYTIISGSAEDRLQE